MPPPAGAREFLGAIWKDRPEGFVELHVEQSDRKRKQTFLRWPGSLDALIAAADAESGKSNIYVGVGIRDKARGRDEDVIALHALWCDIDFKKTPESEAQALFKAFPLRPSIAIRTGGGVHFYWLLREALTEFGIAKDLLRRIAAAFNSDRSVCTLKQIMRLPGYANIKYDARPVAAASEKIWNPELAYNLSDFDFLPAVQEPPRQATALVALPEGAAYVDLDGGRPGDEFNKKAKWPDILSPHGWRVSHEKMGVTYWIRPGKTDGHSATTGFCGELLYVFSENALPFESNTAYTKFAAFTILNHGGDFGEAARALSAAGYGVKKTKDRDDVKANFEITKNIKFDSRPARYVTTIKHSDGTEYTVTTETETFITFHLFRKAFFEATPNKFLAMITQSKWEAMVDAAPLEVREAPMEASSTGLIETELEEFVETAKENPEPGLLRAFAGYKEGERFFTLAAFKAHLKNKNAQRLTDREITHALKNLGWDDGRRRIHGKQPRLWIQSFEHGNGHHKPDEPKEPPPNPELFQNPLLTRARAYVPIEKEDPPPHDIFW